MTTHPSHTTRTLYYALATTTGHTNPAALLAGLHHLLHAAQLLATLTGHPDLATTIHTLNEHLAHTTWAQQHTQDQTQPRPPNQLLTRLTHTQGQLHRC